MNIRVPKDIRETIILESTKLFLANGFRGTSVQEITKAAGIARGTLYWYFGSKDEILITIFRKFETEFLGGLIEAVGNCTSDFKTRYRIFIKYTSEYARDNRYLSVAFTTLLGETVGSNTEAETVVKGIYERYLHFVEGMLEEGKKEGTVGAEVDTSVFAHIIIACNSGMLLEWFIFEKLLDAKVFVGKMRDILLKGIMER